MWLSFLVLCCAAIACALLQSYLCVCWEVTPTFVGRCWRSTSHGILRICRPLLFRVPLVDVWPFNLGWCVSIQAPQVGKSKVSGRSNNLAHRKPNIPIPSLHLPSAGRIQQSNDLWTFLPLMQVQNIRPGFKWGLWAGLVNAALETYVYPLLLGAPPWRLTHNFPDHTMTRPAAQCSVIHYEPCVALFLMLFLRTLHARSSFLSSFHQRTRGLCFQCCMFREFTAATTGWS
jgi:hypothetical protein